MEFRITKPPTSLGYIGGNRGTAAPHLANKAEQFVFREGAGYPINFQNKLVGLFPDFEVAKIFYIFPRNTANLLRQAVASTLPPAIYQG